MEIQNSQRTKAELVAENQALLARLEEAEEALRAIRAGDISELMQTKDSLEKTEERFRLLIEDIRDYAIVALDQHGYIESWNLGAERVKGYRAEEILGHHFSCFYLPEEIRQGKPFHALEVAREQGRFEEEGWRVRKEGMLFWAHVAITALHNRQGDLIGFSKVVRDSTQQKKTEEALRFSEQLFHSAVDSFPGGLAIYDAHRQFQFANLQLLNLSGLSHEQFIGRTNEEIFPPEITTQFAPAFDRCIQERAAQTVEVKTETQAGVMVFIVTFVPILDERGGIRQILGIGFDISARRRAEEQVEAALKKEVILRREIQHRVKNSIQIISSLLFLQSQELEDPKMIEILRECQARARSIALVYSLLSQRDEIATIEFSEYAQQLVGTLSTAYQINREAVTFQISSPTIFFDLDTAVPCGLIITELTSNAIKHAFVDGRKGMVFITLQPANKGELFLSIRDNGVGFPDPFNLNDQHSLGLRLVRDLTEQLNGKLEFRSGEATEIRVRFPFRRFSG